jgi:peroxiredoxin
MRIEPGSAAPPFSARDLADCPVELERYRGRRLLLSFYRYASCPLCNLRLKALTARFPEFQARGLNLLAVFQSPRESLLEYAAADQVPFPVIPDPGRGLYRLYGLESSWWGVARGLLSLRFLDAWRRAGFRVGRREGAVAQLPADFLIGPDLTVAVAHYGADIGDHLPLGRIGAWLDEDAPDRASPLAGAGSGGEAG